MNAQFFTWSFCALLLASCANPFGNETSSSEGFQPGIRLISYTNDDRAKLDTAYKAITAATSSASAGALMKWDASGLLTGTLNGNVVGNATSANSFSGTLVGEVGGTQGATVVNSIGGVTAANVVAAINTANAATSANTASSIVRRDPSGNFSAGTITGTLVGNASSATSFSGTLSGDVTGAQGATTVAQVGGASAASVAAAAVATAGSTSANTASAIVRRDGSGGFSAGTINGTLNGTATSATSFTGNLGGDVTGTQGASVVSQVGGIAAAAIVAGVNAANDANAATFPGLVKRDALGNFSANSITAALNGNALTATTATSATTAATAGSAATAAVAANVSGTVGVANGGTGATTFTQNGVLLGNDGGTLGVSNAGTANQVLRVPPGGGSPAFGAIDLSQGAAVTGALPLAGDLSGTHSGATVAKLQGRSVSNTAPSSGQVLTYNGSAWAPSSATGSTFIRWGNPNAPVGTSLLYSGVGWSNYYAHHGQTPMCVKAGNAGATNVNGGDYTYPMTTGADTYMPGAVDGNRLVQCAMVFSERPHARLLGTTTCPQGWSVAYSGIMFGGWYAQAGSTSECFDTENFDATYSVSSGNISNFYPTILANNIGSTPVLNGYTNNKFLECAVCLKD